MQNNNETGPQCCYTQAGFHTGSSLKGGFRIRLEGNAGSAPEAVSRQAGVALTLSLLLRHAPPPGGLHPAWLSGTPRHIPGMP